MENFLLNAGKIKCHIIVLLSFFGPGRKKPLKSIYLFKVGDKNLFLSHFSRNSKIPRQRDRNRIKPCRLASL